MNKVPTGERVNVFKLQEVMIPNEKMSNLVKFLYLNTDCENLAYAILSEGIREDVQLGKINNWESEL
jgi:hypothetical protein